MMFFVLRWGCELEFRFAVTETIEVRVEQKKVDPVRIEKYINERLSERSFGSSVDLFYFGFELFSYAGEFRKWFIGTKGIKRYNPKNRYLLSVAQFDWDRFAVLDERGQFVALKKGIVGAIDSLSKLKRKPRDFSIEDFKLSITEIMEQYEREHY